MKRRRGRSLNPAEDPRKKQKKSSKATSYKKMILEEIRDFFLLAGGLIILFLVGSIVQIYFYNEQETGGYYPVNGPKIEPCTSCNYERVGHLDVITSGEKGKGDLLIFLHGFPETAWLAWHNQIEYFSNLGY